MLILSALAVLISLRNLKKNMTKEIAVRIATVSAIIFMAQMLNFPITNGTSGHLIGAAFALFLLGVDGAVIAMATVLLVQTIIFGDGGLFSLGANIFNMGIMAVYTANFVSKKIKNQFLQIGVASFASVVAAAIACGIEIGLSGTIDLSSVLIAMILTHAIIGIGEGVITIMMVNVLQNKVRNITLNGALAINGVSFIILAILLPFASPEPDGLEKVAINLGFFEKAIELNLAPIPEYEMTTITSITYLATIFAAMVGTLLVFITGYSMSKFQGVCLDEKNSEK